MLNIWGKSNRAARQTAVNGGRSQPKEEPLKLRLAGDREAAPRRSEEQPMPRPSVRVGSAFAGLSRGKPALEQADWRPCLRYTCFALNKSPPNSKGLPTGRCPVSSHTQRARVSSWKPVTAASSSLHSLLLERPEGRRLSGGENRAAL